MRSYLYHGLDPVKLPNSTVSLPTNPEYEPELDCAYSRDETVPHASRWLVTGMDSHEDGPTDLY
jgi:hypothetical protein